MVIKYFASCMIPIIFYFFVVGHITVQIPSKATWFEKWRETFLKVQFPSDHEFTKHYIACIL